jgi:hypothetical protein
MLSIFQSCFEILKIPKQLRNILTQFSLGIPEQGRPLSPAFCWVLYGNTAGVRKGGTLSIRIKFVFCVII